MPIPQQASDERVTPGEQARKLLAPSNMEYEEAFSKLAVFLFKQYKKKKQDDLLSMPNIETGQIDNNIS